MSKPKTPIENAIIASNDIVEVVGRTVGLKKRGTDHVGLCPFHSEKSPSFTVNQARQFYYCYGCKAGGNVIAFVAERDGITYRDAVVRMLQEVMQADPEKPQPGVPVNEKLHVVAHSATIDEGIAAIKRIDGPDSGIFVDDLWCRYGFASIDLFAEYTRFSGSPINVRPVGLVTLAGPLAIYVVPGPKLAGFLKFLAEAAFLHPKGPAGAVVMAPGTVPSECPLPHNWPYLMFLPHAYVVLPYKVRPGDVVNYGPVVGRN